MFIYDDDILGKYYDGVDTTLLMIITILLFLSLFFLTSLKTI
jgi:hypothetical protein